MPNPYWSYFGDIPLVCVACDVQITSCECPEYFNLVEKMPRTYNVPLNIVAALSSGRGELVLVEVHPWTEEQQAGIRELLRDLINDRTRLQAADHHLRDVLLEHKRSVDGNLERLDGVVAELARAIQGEP